MKNSEYFPAARSVLIVDDNVSEIRLLSEMLRGEGYHLFAALNGRDAFNRALETRPNLVLLDLNMPELDGHATARLFAGDPRLAGIPIIMLTASNAMRDKLGAFSAGVVDYITKPFSAEEVAARLRVHLRMQSRVQSGPHLPTPSSPPAAQMHPDQEPASTWPERDMPPDLRMVLKAQTLLVARIPEPFSLTQLARDVGTNERKLTDAFRSHTGNTAFEFLRSIRHKRACELLLHTDEAVSAIAEATGFSATAAFTFAFRQRCGLTPSQYRESGGIGLGGPGPQSDGGSLR